MVLNVESLHCEQKVFLPSSSYPIRIQQFISKTHNNTLENVTVKCYPGLWIWLCTTIEKYFSYFHMVSLGCYV